MKICSQCGKMNKDNESFCTECGGYLKPSNKKVRNSRNKPSWIKTIWIIAISALVVAIGLFVWAFLIKDKDNKKKNSDISTIEDCYVPNEKNIVYLDETESYGYVNNMLLIYFKKDVSEDRIKEIVADLDGTVVGKINGLGQYQVEVSASSLEELEVLCKEVQEYEEVLFSVTDYVYTTDSNSLTVPEDPWKDDLQGFETVDWNEDYPEGTNWWAEAVKMPSAWSYDSYFSNINVGVVDNGFDINHEDLDIQVINWDVNDTDHAPGVESHGTHVAGVIGATANNGVGITGILRNVNLYGVDCYATDSQIARNITVSSIVDSIDTCITDYGCRVVNLSSGIYYGDPTQTQLSAISCAYNVALNMIIMMYNYGEDFIIVQSAGNGDQYQQGVDAGYYAGYYCSIDEMVFDAALEDLMYSNPGVDIGISYEELMSSVMIVAAADNPYGTGQYQLAEFSNYGEAISVCAPGVGVYSTIVSDNISGAYGYMDGTSMAAPIVAGITALVWSVDQNMTAAQVKDIVLSTATEPVYARQPDDYGSYYMINADAAVERAIELTAGGIQEDDNSPDEAETEYISDLYDLTYEMQNGAIEMWSLDGEFLGGFLIEYPYFFGDMDIVDIINDNFAYGFSLGELLTDSSDSDIDIRVQLDAEDGLPYEQIAKVNVVYSAEGYISFFTETAMSELEELYPNNMNATYRIEDGKLLTYRDVLNGTEEQINDLIKYYISVIYGINIDELDIYYIYDDFGMSEEGLYIKAVTWEGTYDVLIPYTDSMVSVISVSGNSR